MVRVLSTDTQLSGIRKAPASEGGRYIGYQRHERTASPLRGELQDCVTGKKRTLESDRRLVECHGGETLGA